MMQLTTTESGDITFFGASDDLLELRGAIDEEFSAWNGVTVEVKRPDGATVRIRATFGHDGWELVFIHSDPRWLGNISFGQRPDRDDDPAITLTCPAGTTITEIPR